MWKRIASDITMLMICFSLTYVTGNALSPYRIKSLTDIIESLRLLASTSSQGYQALAIVGYILISIFNLLASVWLWNRCHDSFVYGTVLRVLLVANALFLVYYLLFAIVAVALLVMLLVGLSDGPIGSGGGGPVRVRSYRRQDGTRVKSHYRRRPRTF